MSVIRSISVKAAESRENMGLMVLERIGYSSGWRFSLSSRASADL